MGPGNIATAALIAPMAMATAGRVGIPLFLMAIMVGNGANAGSLSPFAPTGIIVNGLMARIGLPGYECQTYLYNLAAHALVAFGGYFLFGGLKLFRRPAGAPSRARTSCRSEATAPFERQHWITLGVIAAADPQRHRLRTSTSAWARSPPRSCWCCSGAADDREAIKRMPWSVIVMVCGVTVLIALLEKARGHRPDRVAGGAVRDARTPSPASWRS